MSTHQEKEKNEKIGKRKAGEQRRQAHFKEAGCYPSAIVQGGCTTKNGLCEGSAQGNWDPQEGHSHFNTTQTELGPHPHVEVAVDWCSSILLALHVYTIYTTKILHFTI